MEKSMYYELLGGLCYIILNVYAGIPTDTLHSHKDYITGNFENINVVTNTTVLLQCPTMNKTKIQWKLLGDANSPEEKLLKADSNYYEFDLITAHDKGIYGCFANGSLIKKYNLTVFEPPHFRKRMPRLIIKPAGNMIRLNCKARGFPQPSIIWYRYNQSPPRRELLEIQINKWSLTIEDSRTNDAGNYTCVVCNVVGCINFTFTVDVLEMYHNKPIITRKLENKTVSVGDSFCMKCYVVSDLHPHISWAKFINETTSVTLKGIDYMQPEVLGIFNARHEDEGWYACLATNSLGTTMSKAYVQVVDEPDMPDIRPRRYHNKPIITSELENKTVLVGANFSMKCKFVSDLHSHILWAKFINGTTPVTLEKSYIGNVESEVFEIFNVTHGDEGWYAFFVSNSLGTTMSKAYLQVVDV